MSKTCTHCKTKTQKTVNAKKIPLIAAECEATRQQKTIIRLIGLCAVLALLLFGSNLAWIVYESQYEMVTETYDILQNTEYGDNNCIVKGGEIHNG